MQLKYHNNKHMSTCALKNGTALAIRRVKMALSPEALWNYLINRQSLQDSPFNHLLKSI